MPRPELLEPARLLQAMSSTPSRPSELATKLAVSRATVHRKLEKLLEQALVVRVGDGPQAAYRLPSAAEQLDRSRAEAAKHPQVRLLMTAATANAVQSMLDLYTRVGIGQMREIAGRARFGEITHADGTALSHEELDNADMLCGSLSQHMLGFSPNASHGIYSPHVHPRVTLAWALQRAIRHRIAWDRQPQGGMGVAHDEPLSQDNIAGLFVHSDQPDANGLPQRYIVEMPADCAQLMAHALKFTLRVETGDVQAVVEMARDQELRGMDGVVVSGEALDNGRTLAGALGALLSGVSEGAYNAQLTQQQVRGFRVLKALEAFEETGEQVDSPEEEGGAVVVSAVADSPWAVDIDNLPAGYMLNFQRGNYRVIAPTEEGQLAIVAQSTSLKTVLQMAENVATGQRPRSFA